MAEINTHKISVLSELFEQNKAFKIPHFQRSYTWEKDLVQDLWNDIKDIVLADNNREHFMGVFIFADEEEGSDRRRGPTEEMVIDGQQRMTTLTILLRAMYDNLDPNTDLAGRVLDLITGGRYEPQSFRRLILGEDADEFFEKYIQDKDPGLFRERRRGKKKVEKRIVQAHSLLFAAIQKVAKEHEMSLPEFVDFLFRKLKQKVVAVRIKVPSDSDAYTIFETINSKKVELSVSELLKNYLFLQSDKLAGSVLRTTRKKWQDIIENLSQNDEEIEPSQFIRHYWISNIESVTEKNLYRAIKDYYTKHKDDLKNFISSLADQSLLYSKLVGAYRDDDDKVINDRGLILLGQISSLRIKQCYPLLLAALSLEVSAGQFNELAKAIVRVSVLRGLTDRNPNELEDTYATKSRALRKSGTIVIPEIIKEINSFAPKEDEAERTILENEISEQLARFILTQYEAERRTGETKVEKLSLEHILPQTPEDTSLWGMTPEEHLLYVGRFGNLALVGNRINTKASNRPFEEKRKILRKSEIKTTVEIAEQNEKWGKEEIQKRTKVLFDFVVSNWK